MPARLLDDIRSWLWPLGRPEEAPDAEPGLNGERAATACAFVVDDHDSICNVISAILGGLGIEAAKFNGADEAVSALARGNPEIVFLDIALRKSDAVDVIRGLGKSRYRGIVQLMSGSDIRLLDDICRIGERHGLNMWPPITKPFRADTIREVIARAHLGVFPETAGGCLAEALSRGWLELWYQPKIDLRARRLVGAEGLIRCRHPSRGLLSPARLLSGASEKELAALTEYVVAKALADWHDIFALGINLNMAVNTDIASMTAVAPLIREHRPKSPEWRGLILEITESQIVKDVALVHEIATQLHIYGVTLSVDDFGEGYSSFARLRELPFSELKLDRSFVHGCGTDIKAAGICQAVIDLAHHFGAIAVAEGIEKISDLHAVFGMGCDMGQGYLLAHPMPKANFLTMLRQRTAGNSKLLDHRNPAARAASA